MRDNVVTNITALFYTEGTVIESGDSGGGDTNTLCLNIATTNTPAAGNNSSDRSATAFEDYYINERSGTTFLLQGFAGTTP